VHPNHGHVGKNHDTGGGAYRDPCPASLMEDLWPGTEHESSVADKDWGSPVPTPSHSPTVMSRGPSGPSSLDGIFWMTKMLLRHCHVLAGMWIRDKHKGLLWRQCKSQGFTWGSMRLCSQLRQR
jgi:hypothetical protein